MITLCKWCAFGAQVMHVYYSFRGYGDGDYILNGEPAVREFRLRDSDYPNDL